MVISFLASGVSCSITTYRGSNFRNSARVERGFLRGMNSINSHAGVCKVQVGEKIFDYYFVYPVYLIGNIFLEIRQVQWKLRLHASLFRKLHWSLSLDVYHPRFPQNFKKPKTKMIKSISQNQWKNTEMIEWKKESRYLLIKRFKQLVSKIW